MQLNVALWLHDCFTPLEDLEESFVMLRDRFFCSQHSNAGRLQRAGVALFDWKVQSSIFFILSLLLFLVSYTADQGVKIGLWKVSFSICPLLHPTRAGFPLFKFLSIGFLVKKPKCYLRIQ